MRYAANRIRRDVRAGRRSTIGNRVCAKSVSGVRIPISPPEFITPLARAAFFYARGGLDRIMESGPHGVSRETLVRFCRTCYYALLRMADAMPPCGGVAEWLNAAVSKTVSPVTRVTRVRIPPPPPERMQQVRESSGLFFYFRSTGFEPITSRAPTFFRNFLPGCFRPEEKKPAENGGLGEDGREITPRRLR